MSKNGQMTRAEVISCRQILLYKSLINNCGVIHLIAFSIMMWFVSIILLFLSISLLRGNYASVHGKVFDSTDNKEGYAKALGKPVLLLGVGFSVVGIIAVVLQQKNSITIAVVFMVIILIISAIWFGKIQKRFS